MSIYEWTEKLNEEYNNHAIYMKYYIIGVPGDLYFLIKAHISRTGCKFKFSIELDDDNVTPDDIKINKVSYSGHEGNLSLYVFIKTKKYKLEKYNDDTGLEKYLSNPLEGNLSNFQLIKEFDKLGFDLRNDNDTQTYENEDDISCSIDYTKRNDLLIKHAKLIKILEGMGENKSQLSLAKEINSKDELIINLNKDFESLRSQNDGLGKDIIKHKEFDYNQVKDELIHLKKERDTFKIEVIKNIKESLNKLI